MYIRAVERFVDSRLRGNDTGVQAAKRVAGFLGTAVDAAVRLTMKYRNDG